MTHLERLAASLRRPDLAPISITPPTVPEHAKAAAVLILLTREDDSRVTLTERSANLRAHAGQISFPGGGSDEQDASPIATALRESHEEIGLDPAAVRILGTLRTAWVPVSGFAVTPVIASWDADVPIAPADPAEVAAVHEIPLTTLADPANRVSSRHFSGYVGPAFRLGELFIWGFTAHLLSWVLDLGEWSRPWDASRIVDVPQRFQRDGRPPI